MPNAVNAADVAGSSPRVRGKPEDAPVPDAPGGLIPARAGKTMRWAIMVEVHRAHPRACGENEEVRQAREGQEGSSPRVRGKLVVLENAAPCPRLIPARAGKTRPSSDASTPSWAHPRACGENVVWEGVGMRAPGSSPRVRGKR